MIGRQKFKTPEEWSAEIFRLITRNFSHGKTFDPYLAALLDIAHLRVDPDERIAEAREKTTQSGDRVLFIRLDLTSGDKGKLYLCDEEVSQFDIKTNKPKAVAKMFAAWVAQEFHDDVLERGASLDQRGS